MHRRARVVFLVLSVVGAVVGAACSSFDGVQGDGEADGSVQMDGMAAGDGGAVDGATADSTDAAVDECSLDGARCFNFDDVDSAIAGWSTIFLFAADAPSLTDASFVSPPHSARFETLAEAGAQAKTYLVYTAPATNVSLTARLLVEGSSFDSAYLVSVRGTPGNSLNLYYTCADAGPCDVKLDSTSAPDSGIPTVTQGCGTFSRKTWVAFTLTIAAGSAQCTVGGVASNPQPTPAFGVATPDWLVGLDGRSASVDRLVFYDDVVFRY
jgi:hypothetical protein